VTTPRLPSASGVWRAFSCPASCSLPTVERQSGEAARFGTSVHLFLEKVPQVGAEAALLLVPEPDRGFCSSIPLEKMPWLEPGKALQEVALVLDMDTGKAKAVGQSIGRNYPAVYPRQIAGTADVVATIGKRRGMVRDYKTGAESNVPPPAENPQLLTLACAAARVYGWDEVVVALDFVRDGAVWPKEATVDELDLDAHLSRLRALEVELWKPEPALSEGPWCLWCASFQCCPAKTSLALAILPKTDASLTLHLDATTAPVIWERLHQAQVILDSIRGVCEEFVTANPVELPDGRILGAQETTKERVADGALAWEHLLKQYGSDVAEAATIRHASKESIRAALRIPLKEAKERGEKTTLDALERSVIGALREAGAVKDVTTTRVGPHWPKRGT
jgi:hypothetical protein